MLVIFRKITKNLLDDGKPNSESKKNYPRQSSREGFELNSLCTHRHQKFQRRGDSPNSFEENKIFNRNDLCLFQSTTERSIHLPERLIKPSISESVSASITVQFR